MKRRPGLIALSHDHHHALVAARRLRDGTGDPAASAAFLRFFADESVRHFRDEEERLFPLVADADEARPLLVQALLEHQQLHALAARLAGGEAAATGDLAELLEAHVRFEERELFPMIERLLGDRVPSLELEAERPVRGSGPVWGAASEDLNATLLAWGPEEGPPEHVNDERDVLLFVVDGTATLIVDEDTSELVAGAGSIVAKGSRRQLTAGSRGVRYLSVHLRRPLLTIEPAQPRG